MMMKAKYLSTSDLAKKTGTSRQVISAIINESWKEKRISQATYERIRKAMDDLGFVPNRTAISLRKKKEARVGLLCHDPLYSHTSTALEKLNHYFLDSEKSVEIHMSGSGGLGHAIREMMGHRVDNIIILLSPMLPNFGENDLQDNSLIRLLRAVPHFIYNFPFHVHPKEVADSLINCGSHLIGFSRAKAYVPFMEHLLDKKINRVLIDEKIFSLINKSTETKRMCARISEIKTYPNPQGGNLEVNPFILGTKVANDLLSDIKRNNYDYIVTSSDGIAQGMAHVLTKHNVKVPDDLKILGFDKIDSMDFHHFPTSTIEVPVGDMISTLISLLENPLRINKSHICETKLHLH